MKITCQSCQSKYNVADEKVQGKIVKIRCRKCGSTIVVQGNGGAAANGSNGTGGGPAGAAGDSDGAQWHVNAGEADPRTLTMAELVEAYNAGTIAQDTFIWTDGMDDWKPLSEVEAVVSALHLDAGAAANAPAPEPAYRSPAASVDEIAPAYAAPQAAPEPAPEPRRAAVKREARARDLFGTGVAAEEVQTSAPAVPQMMSTGAVDDATNKMTGQRNENSVLFSLAVLTKDADDRVPEEPAPRSTSRNTEDSGLIDLKALAAKAESMRPAGLTESNAFTSPLGLGSAPLGGSMSVLGGPLGDAPQQKSKLPLIIGGGAGIALLLVLGIVIGVKLAGSNTPAPDASATASAAAPTVTASAEPTPAVSATAEASATPAPSASVAARPKTGGGGYHPPSGGGAKPSSGGATAAGGAAAGGATPPPTPPPPKKAGSDCGCNGDLMCLMKCSTH